MTSQFFMLRCSLPAVAGAVMLIGAARAEPQTVAELANYTGADRQTVLETGARKEGRVVVYSTATQTQPLLDAFRAKYPFIEVEIPKGDSANIARRVVEEYRARTYLVDAFELSADGLLLPREEHVLQPFTSPEARHYAPAAVESGHHWISARESYIGIGFDKRQIPEAEGPKTYADLLDPKWKGRMAIAGSASTGANWIGAMMLTMGRDFISRLARQDIRVFPMSGRAVANLMIAGEVAISPTTYNSHVQSSNAQGAELAWFAPGPVPVTDTSVALAARAPHPHAALLLIDFLLSHEGQALYRKLGYSSARTDIAQNTPGTLEKLYLANRPDYIDEFEDWVALLQTNFLMAAPAKRKRLER